MEQGRADAPGSQRVEEFVGGPGADGVGIVCPTRFPGGLDAAAALIGMNGMKPSIPLAVTYELNMNNAFKSLLQLL